MIGFALVAFVLVLLALRYLVNADPSFLADVLKNSLMGVAAVVIIFLLITGRASPYILPVLLLIVFPYILRRYRSSGVPSGSSSQDSVKESYDILGLAPGASREDIIQAHRRLMKKNHPDKGGSAYLAKKLNEAKDILLNQ